MNDVAASVRARLLNVAKAQGVDFNQVLVRFALERILYRLSQSEHADRFLLKGALLFTLWYDMPHRATRDADLLGFGASDLESVAQTFRDIASVGVDDGIVFDPASVIAEEIRKDAGYAGARILIGGRAGQGAVQDADRRCNRYTVTLGSVDFVYPARKPNLMTISVWLVPLFARPPAWLSIGERKQVQQTVRNSALRHIAGLYGKDNRWRISCL